MIHRRALCHNILFCTFQREFSRSTGGELLGRRLSEMGILRICETELAGSDGRGEDRSGR